MECLAEGDAYLTRRFVWLCAQSQSAQAASKVEVPGDSLLFLASKMRQLAASRPDLVSKCQEMSQGTDLQPQPSQRGGSSGSSKSKNEYHLFAERLGQHMGKKIVGLAIIEVGPVYRGVLSQLNHEQRSLLHFAADSAKRVGCVFLRVLDAIALAQPQDPIVSGFKSYANHKTFTITSHSQDSLVGAPSVDGRTPNEQLADWAMEAEYEICVTELSEDDLGPPCALVLPVQVAVLAAHGLISHLVIPPTSRFAPNPYLNPVIAKIRECSRDPPNLNHLPRHGLALDTETAKILESECLSLAEGGLDRDMLLKIGNSLREHMQGRRQGDNRVAFADASVSEDGDLDLQQQIVYLEGLFRATAKEQVARSRLQPSTKGFQGVWNNDMGCRVTYKPAFLLQCVILSFNLRSSHAVPDVIHAAVQCLPEFWKETLKAMLAESQSPSPSTMTRARLSVDVAFMLFMRSRHAQLLQDPRATLYVKVDSTPLGGNNWEVAEYQLVAGADLKKAGQLALSLARLGSECVGAQITSQQADQFVQITQELSGLLSHHVLPLGALGTRRATVAHIIHSIIFRLRLECSEWADVEKFISLTFSLTADQGTESKLGDVTEVNLQDNFPWWPAQDPFDQGELVLLAQNDPALESEEMFGLQMEEAPQVREPPVACSLPGFVNSVRIPPHFHIIDKVSNSLLDALTLSWPRIERHFKAVVGFFHAGHTRKHFIKLCLPPEVHFLFSSGPPAWQGGRVWGVLQRIVEWVLKREGAIKRNFDVEKLFNKGTKRPHPQVEETADANISRDQPSESSKREFFDDRDGATMSACGSAVKDPFFWGAMHMLSNFAEVLDHMQAWMLGCPCHSQHVRKEVQEWSGRSGSDVVEQCPMRGRRAADLATGQHRVVFNEIAREQEDMLFMVHLSALPEDDRRDLLLDFAAGRARLITELELRLSVWEALPLKLFALAFHEEDIARASVLSCFVQFSELSAEEQASEVHALTRKLLSSDGPLRSLVVDWVQGGDMSEELQDLRSQMLLTPTLEISVERLHAFLKQRTLATHHISGAYASLQLRKPEILRCHSEHFSELSECCGLASTPAQMVESLGLQFYPNFIDYHYEADGEGEGADSNSTVKMKSAVPHALVDAVIYRRHLDLQYMHLPKPSMAAHKQVRASQVEVSDDTEDNIAYEHFRATFQPSTFYSVKKVEEHLEGNPALTHEDALEKFFLPMKAVLQAEGAAADAAALRQLQLEITGDEAGLPVAAARASGVLLDFGQGLEDDQHGSSVVRSLDHGHDLQIEREARDTRFVQQSANVFFRIVDARPSRRKRLRTDLMKGIGPSQLAVSVHNVVHTDSHARTVTVSLQPDSENNVARLFDGSLDVRKILKWEVGADIVWLWRGHETEAWLNAGAVPAVLTALFSAKAWEGVGQLAMSDTDEGTVEALRALCEAGLVRQLEQEGEQTRWQLCDSARMALRSGIQLCNAVPGLQVRPDQPPQSMTVWELVQSLLSDGFEKCAFAQGPEPYNSQRGAPKKFYSVSGKWCRTYLQVLVCRKDLLQHDIASVPHGQKASLYKAMLDKMGLSKQGKSRGVRLDFADGEGLVRAATRAPVARASRRRDPLGARRVGNVDNGAGIGDWDDENGEGAPLPPPRAAPRARRQKTHYWPHETGPCLLTFKPPKTWQATCPRAHSHKNPARPGTRCTRTMSFDPDLPASETQVLRLLRYWLNSCQRFGTRSQHMEFKPRPEDVPPDEVLIAEGLPADYTSEPEAAGFHAAAGDEGGDARVARPAGRRRVRGKMPEREPASSIAHAETEPSGEASASAAGATHGRF